MGADGNLFQHYIQEDSCMQLGGADHNELDNKILNRMLGGLPGTTPTA